MFSYFNCWNRLSSKEKTTESWHLQLTPSNFLVAVSLDLPLVALGCWQPAWLPGSEVLEPGLPWLGSAGKAARPVQLPEQRWWSKANNIIGHKHRGCTQWQGNTRSFILQTSNTSLTGRRTYLLAPQLGPMISRNWAKRSLGLIGFHKAPQD